MYITTYCVPRNSKRTNITVPANFFLCFIIYSVNSSEYERYFKTISPSVTCWAIYYDYFGSGRGGLEVKV